MTTVANVRRALHECCETPGFQDTNAATTLLNSPTALTILANRLSDMGTAGNAARDANLADLRAMYQTGVIQSGQENALGWAIDQLTPPEPANGSN